MKTDLGGGAYLEPDEEPRNTTYHKRIIRVTRIPNTKVGHRAVLECGHEVMMFGNLTYADGVALCTRCRDEAGDGTV